MIFLLPSFLFVVSQRICQICKKMGEGKFIRDRSEFGARIAENIKL